MFWRDRRALGIDVGSRKMLVGVVYFGAQISGRIELMNQYFGSQACFISLSS